VEKDSNLSEEMAGALRRYLQIQVEEQRLREEKSGLQETLGRHMAQRRIEYWFPEVDGQALKVRCHEAIAIEYDEEALRRRLGERYLSILAPDIRKLRRCLADVGPALAPFLDKVGSPAPEKVRAAVERGVVQTSEFAGAFQKTTRRTVAVARVRPDPGPEGGTPAADPSASEGF
jgi:hypothetical protein